MLVSFSYCDNIICFLFFFSYLIFANIFRIYGLKVVNITEFLILILKVVRLIVTITSISVSISISISIIFLLILLLLGKVHLI